MWYYIWPIILVIASNVFYNICTKSTPLGANPLVSLSVTYLVAALATGLLYFFTGSGSQLLNDYKSLNWTSYVLGLAIVGLEFGYINLYRAGWNISTGSLVANVSLAIILIFVGVLLYHEQITRNQMIGIGLCLLGILFLNK